jgi:hypothetical protein
MDAKGITALIQTSLKSHAPQMVKLNFAITQKTALLTELNLHQTANSDAGTGHPDAPGANAPPVANTPAFTKTYPMSVSNPFKSKLPKYNANTFSPAEMTTYFALCNGELLRRIEEATKKLDSLKLALEEIKASMTDTLNKSYVNCLALTGDAEPAVQFCDANLVEIKTLIRHECASISVAYYQTQRAQASKLQKEEG